MTSDARQEYGEQLRLRKAGIPSDLEPGASLAEAKPHFYADARVLIDNVREVYAEQRLTAPPYGLVDSKGEPFTGFDIVSEKSWVHLERLLSASARRAFEVVTPPSTGCPYNESLRNLGSMLLNPDKLQSPEVERLREITFPGAQLAPATIVNILKRMPEMAEANGATAAIAALARNSARTLLREPLRHPQQHARASTFCLGDGLHGSDLILDRGNFMPHEVIEDYTKLGQNSAGQEAIVWAKPTSDFTLRVDVHVANRLLGSETDFEGDHITLYPAGTRLGDIEVDEPTIGCPGSQLAYDMWDQAVDVIVAERLW